MLCVWMYKFSIVCLLVLGGGTWITAHTFGNNSVATVSEDGWAPWRVYTSLEKLVATGIQSTEHVARNKSLYHLRYPGPHNGM